MDEKDQVGDQQVDDGQDIDLVRITSINGGEVDIDSMKETILGQL